MNEVDRSANDYFFRRWSAGFAFLKTISSSRSLTSRAPNSRAAKCDVQVLSRNRNLPGFLSKK